VLTAAGGRFLAAAETPRRPAWGTQDLVLTHVAFTDFTPVTCTFGFTTPGPGLAWGIYSNCANGEAVAVAHLPSGALLAYLELDFEDTNPDEGVLLVLQDCRYQGDDCRILKVLSSSGAPGIDHASADLTDLAYTMDNNARELVLVVVTGAGDATTILHGAYVGYRLQISPAPATPTFGDVPAAHLYFRAIEALAASGITAGCGSGNFCPNQNVTRGEMAAFFARALGLRFRN
jgi:hypothetical protein